MPNTDLRIATIRDDTRTLLGAGSVDVELGDNEIKAALRETLRIYNRHRPGEGYSKLNVVSGVQKYEITHPGLAGVTHLEAVQRRFTTGQPDVFDPTSVITGTGIGGIMGLQSIGEVDQMLHYREDSKRVLSAEIDWHGQWEMSKYYLYVSLPQAATAYDVSYRYTFHFIVDETANVANALIYIPDSDSDWVMGYVKAVCKEILARTRGKFGGIADDSGSMTEVDWSTLADEARTEKTDLLEQIKRRRRPLDPSIE